MYSPLPIVVVVENAVAPGSATRTDAPAPAATPNGGETSSLDSGTLVEAAAPRLVIRGESKQWEIDSDNGERFIAVKRGKHLVLIAIPQPVVSGSPYSALTDYLNCTFPYSPETLDPITFAFELAEFMGEKVTPAIDRGRGLHGYAHSYDLGESSGQFAYGGQRGTALLSLPGLACALVKDWIGLRQFLEVRLGARITRWDGAVDDVQGIHTVDMSVDLYKSGAFGCGGRRPTCDQRGNWIELNGCGRTFYVGKRENGKMLRVYEKGMELGIPWHPWVRHEVEMHNRDRVIPWDVLQQPGFYVVGAYPKALAWVQEEMQRIKTLQKEVSISYDVLTHHASRCYGKLFTVMLEQEGSAEAVLNKLMREGRPARLAHPAFTAPGGGLE